MEKKKVLVIALAICLLATISMGTLAWFTDSDSVKNEFLVADSDDNTADAIFSVDVWEQYDSNGDGDFNEAKDIERTDDGISYKDILPGDKLSKIVHVENTGHYDQYIRVFITISDKSVWEEMIGADKFDDYDVSKHFGWFDPTMWDMAHAKKEYVDDSIRYTLYYNGVLDAGEKITVFENILIPTELTRGLAAKLGADGFTVTVKAQAVQTENVGSGAYNAFQTVGMGY